ncbi:MAG: hypothetical protein FWB75_01475 [Oscillospiraceae bacterium]|nr:hypothetical protein [Oscillospiraceae bacterium]
MKIRHYVSLAIAAVIVIGSFFLPNAVAGITDMRRLDTLILVDSERISFEAVPELTLTERITLAGSSSADILPLHTGSNMSLEAAELRAVEEVARFFSAGPFQLDYEDVVISEGLASLIVDALVTTRYMIIWEFDITDHSGNSVNVVIDDRTGIIVRLIYRVGNREEALLDGEFWSRDDLFYTAARSLSEMMTAYYGVSVVLGDYSYRGIISFYRADITEAGLTVPMYGNVRSASFTVNERV